MTANREGQPAPGAPECARSSAAPAWQACRRARRTRLLACMKDALQLPKAAVAKQSVVTRKGGVPEDVGRG